MPHQVFICHSTKDKLVADAACAALEAGRISCFIAPRDILPSVEWGEAIVNAILNCEVVLLIFSNNANNSPDVRREINLAIGEQKVLVPFRIEDVLPTGSIKYAVSNRHWLDAIDPPMEGRLVELREKIALLINRPPDVEELWKPPPPEPPAAPPAGPSEAELAAKAEALRQEDAAREAEALRQQQARLVQEVELRRQAEAAALKAEEDRRAQAAAAEQVHLQEAEELRKRQFRPGPPPSLHPAPLPAPVSIAQPAINSNMALAILTTIFCCPPIGIFSIFKANKINKLLEAHDYDAARQAAKENLRLIIITAVVGILFIIIALASKS